MSNNNIKPANSSRRSFLKRAGQLAALTALTGCVPSGKSSETVSAQSKKEGEMTYRTTPTTGDKVSLLGYGCMRLPKIDGSEEFDQEAINRQVDYALEHGVNYFDTSPAYCRGLSERCMGIALSRHPRDSYYIATKLSNFAPSTWPREKSIEMYHNSLKELQTDYIDYLLLHAIGGGGMESYNARYEDNGMLDFLINEREEGRIRNLGFSYHGDVEVFDHLLKLHDEGRLKWDFVQIQLNYIDWAHAKEVNESNTNAEYLYGELRKRNIPAVVMEPLLGGRLASLPNNLLAMLKQERPDDSTASWAFRYAGTPEGILTVLSGMTYMEHLVENVNTYSPLEPVSEEEDRLLQKVATMLLQFPTVPCTDCKYCMPCPHGLDIPAIFAHYNKCVNAGDIVTDEMDPVYAKARRDFLVGYDRSVPKLRQADHCIHCDECLSHCPQSIDIPGKMDLINNYAESLKRKQS